MLLLLCWAFKSKGRARGSGRCIKSRVGERSLVLVVVVAAARGTTAHRTPHVPREKNVFADSECRTVLAGRAQVLPLFTLGELQATVAVAGAAMAAQAAGKMAGDLLTGVVAAR